jgi:hypothetical protein
MGYSDSEDDDSEYDSESDDEEMAYNQGRGKSSGKPYMICERMPAGNLCECILYFAMPP